MPKQISIESVTDINFVLTPKENDEINERITKFVFKMDDKSQSVSYYKNKRNVFASRSKIQEDIFLGKKAEFIALYGICKEYGFPQIDIDLEIRKGRKKGWAVDLPFSDKGDFPDVHVKSCSAKTFRYCKDYSWTFQYSDNDKRGGKDNIFKSPSTDLVALVHLESPESNEGTIKAIMPWQILEKKLKDPKKSTLIGLKRCIYYQDLVQGDK